MSTAVKKNNTIVHTRGDTLRLKVEIEKDGEAYTPQSGDEIRFALKHQTMNSDDSEYTDPEPLIEKVIPSDTQVLELDPADTKPLGFGDYAYDIQITFEDGTVDTFITASLFQLTEEVE